MGLASYLSGVGGLHRPRELGQVLRGRRMTHVKKIATLLIFPLLLAATPTRVPDPGPAPSFEQGVALGEAAIKDSLIEPSSGQFEWPYAFTALTTKPLFSKAQTGWFTCGFVNARNRMGGFTGRSWFWLMIKNNAILELEIGTSGEIDEASVRCANAVKNGLLGPAPARIASAGATQPLTPQATIDAAQTSADSSAAQGGIGISFFASPLGAIIMAVGHGSDGEKAGLKAGETVESVNGVSIKNFPNEAMVQAFHAETPTLKLGVVGVGNVDVVRVRK